ncbi:BA14K family protein [Ensifer soli]|uniref:BA14K family protein n=1 Tax=Ciceribacter sp. sgz301302 TaxID=3342379 RepID=UPI0035B861C2
MIKLYRLAAAAMLGIATVLTGMPGAQALPAMAPVAAGQTDVVTVYHRGHPHRRHYRPYHHHYRPHYRPRVYVAPRIIYRDPSVRRGYGAHVRWCLNRYRSYDPATNRYLAYAGVYRACRSPYR